MPKAGRDHSGKHGAPPGREKLGLSARATSRNGVRYGVVEEHRSHRWDVPIERSDERRRIGGDEPATAGRSCYDHALHGYPIAQKGELHLPP